MSRLLNTSRAAANSRRVETHPAAEEAAACNATDGAQIRIPPKPDFPWHTCTVRSQCRSAFAHHRPRWSQRHSPLRYPRATHSLRRSRHLNPRYENPLRSARPRWRLAACQSSLPSQGCQRSLDPASHPSAHAHTGGISNRPPGSPRNFCLEQARPSRWARWECSRSRRKKRRPPAGPYSSHGSSIVDQRAGPRGTTCSQPDGQSAM
jgi:hypothetical protein